MPRKPNSLLRQPAGLALTLTAALAGQTAAALAACPVELAVYREAGTGAMIDFHPGGNATVTNAFRLVLDKGVVLEGMVMWDPDVPRPVGMLTHDCPEGDATGEELAACTVWHGVVYSADREGKVDLMPPEGTDAPETLILADLGRAIAAAGLSEAPWDAFALHGCQE